MEIRIMTETLTTNKLTISEYLYLKLLYGKITDPEMFKVLDRVDDDTLQLRGFIRILEDKVVLRTKAIELFEGKNLYVKFLTMFPVKSPEGRYLSPLRNDTIKGRNLEAKWKKLFKNKPHLEEHAIRVLEAELKWRRKNNKLEYIHNMEAWLNQGDYENYAYLLEEDQQENLNDLM